MITRFGHVGIIVKNLDETLKVYERLFALKPKAVKTTQESRIAFIPIGGGELELIQPLDPKVAAARGEGIHHIALITDNIESDIKRMRKLAAKTDKKTRLGAHGVKIAFIYPQSVCGVSVELCQEPGQQIY